MPTFFSAVPLLLRSRSCSVLGHPSLIFFNPSTVLAFYSKYNAKLKNKINSVEEFLLRGLARCCCDERTWQQRGLWIMKHMWPCAERGERHAWRGMTGWTASWAGGGWKCEFPKTTKNDRGGSRGETTALVHGFESLLTGTGGGTGNCTWKRIQKRRGDESLFMLLPEDSSLSHSSDSGGREISTAALQNEGGFPSCSYLLILPKASQCAHHICMRGAHQHIATLLFFKFYWYLFIYTQSGTRNTFWNRPNMPLHVRMLKTFAFFSSIHRILVVQMGGYASSWCASIHQTGTGKNWVCNMCIYGCFWEVFYLRISQDWSPLMPPKSERTRAE